MSPKDFMKRLLGYAVVLVVGGLVSWWMFGGHRHTDWEQAYFEAGYNTATVAQIKAFTQEPLVKDTSGATVVAGSILVQREQDGKPFFAATYNLNRVLLNKLPKPVVDKAADTTGVGKK